MSNKKGFTLVELLAVTVVLAIIMVIATMSVNTSIVKTRATSFVKTMDMVVKNAKEIVQLEELNENLLKERLDYSKDEYDIFVSKNNDNTYLIVLKATDKGEFKNVDLTKAEQNNLYKYEAKTICTNLSDNCTLNKPGSCGG